MKVYIAIDGWDSDGDRILGVFSTRRAAQEVVDTKAVHYRVTDIDRKSPIESGWVEEHEVQTNKEK